jgi:CheY-like chemotaxis protein
MNETQTSPSKKRVMVVDDNSVLAQTVKHLLETNGYEAITFPDGAAALKHVLHQQADAVICDLDMPQLEGDKFYTTIERVEPRLAERFVFVTGVVDDPHFRPFIDRVGCPVLDKPVQAQHLLDALEKVLAREN